MMHLTHFFNCYISNIYFGKEHKQSGRCWALACACITGERELERERERIREGERELERGREGIGERERVCE